MRKIFICLLLTGVLLCGCKQESYFENTGFVDTFSDSTEESGENDVSGNSMPESIQKPQTGYVQLTGAVNNPGVYEITDDTRLFMVIEAAGGLKEDAATDYLNQEMVLSDGESIHVPTVIEAQAFKEQNAEDFGKTNEDDGLININEADISLLMTLPGIGESKAKQILEYRNEQGYFNSIEDIMNIGGIKEGVFNKIKDYIKV